MYFNPFTNDDENAKFEKLRDNFSWFYSNYDNFRKGYQNQYIAVKDKKHIDDANLDTLIKRLGLKNYNDSIAIEFVDD